MDTFPLDNKYHFSARIQTVLDCQKYARCNSSICSICYRRKSLVHAQKISNILHVTDEFDQLLDEPVKLYRAVFTQADRSGTLYRRIRRLYGHLNELTKARSPFRSKYMLGGVWRLHVGYSGEGGWNPHFDTLLETRTLPLGTIEQSWKRISGSIAEVQPVRRTSMSFRRISNYVTKLPFHDVRVPNLALAEKDGTAFEAYAAAERNGPLLEAYADATYGRRKIEYLGTWRRRPRKRG